MKIKQYVLMEDVVIPKGTVFTQSRSCEYVEPIEAVIGDGLVDSSIMIIINNEVVEEMGDKIKEKE